MRLSRIISPLLVLTAVGALGMATSQAAAAESDLATFMQLKLRHAEKVLEGLATEDYALIAKNSQAMSLLCEDEMWSVLQTPEYRERSLEFRRSVDAITEAARKKNLEAAALGYVDATMKCVTCHKYVRATRNGK